MNTHLRLIVIFSCLLVFSLLPARCFGSGTAGDVILLAAAGEKTDFPGIYKKFLSTMVEGNYDLVWKELATASKNKIASAIAKDAKTEEVARIMTMLNDNENNVRTIFLGTFVKDGDVASIVNKGIFSLKSSSGTQAVVTITLNKQPKDFRIISEDDQWKFDFFTDLLSD